MPASAGKALADGTAPAADGPASPAEATRSTLSGADAELLEQYGWGKDAKAAELLDTLVVVWHDDNARREDGMLLHVAVVELANGGSAAAAADTVTGNEVRGTG